MNPLIQSLTEGQLRSDILTSVLVTLFAFTQKLSKELANVSRSLKVLLFHVKVKGSQKCTLFVKSQVVSG